MSGYLEVKYPFKSSLGLNPFKTWKKQWCILRPSATLAGGGSLAVYCSEAGAAAGCVGLPPGGAVRRAASRSRAHAFAVFAAGDCRKPRVLLAAASAQDAQLWMDKIKALLTGSLHEITVYHLSISCYVLCDFMLLDVIKVLPLIYVDSVHLLHIESCTESVVQ